MLSQVFANSDIVLTLLSMVLFKKSRIKNKERPLGEIKWAWHRKSRGEWAEPCGNLHTWVGPSFLHTYSCSLCNRRRTRVRADAWKKG